MQRPHILDKQDFTILKRFALYGAIAGVLIVVLILGIVLGVRYSIKKPNIVDLHIIGGVNQPVGSSFIVSETAHIPDNCIPTTMRWVLLDVPINAPKGTKRHIDLLPSDPLPDDYPNIVPIPLSDQTGCGDYFEKKTIQGCGAGNGIFGATGTKSKPVRVCLLPPIVSIAKVVK